MSIAAKKGLILSQQFPLGVLVKALVMVITANCPGFPWGFGHMSSNLVHLSRVFVVVVLYNVIANYIIYVEYCYALG